MWCIRWTVLYYSAAGFLPLTEAQEQKTVDLCLLDISWSAINCDDDSGLVISGINTATFMNVRDDTDCDFEGGVEEESDIIKCFPKNVSDTGNRLTLELLQDACLGKPQCEAVGDQRGVNTNVWCYLDNGSIHNVFNAIMISYTCEDNGSAWSTSASSTTTTTTPPGAPSTQGTSRQVTGKTLTARTSTTAERSTSDIQAWSTSASSTTTATPPGAPNTQGTSRKATGKTLTTHASTTAEPDLADNQALITGAAVAGVLLLCVGIAVIICLYRKKSRRKRNESINEPGNPHEPTGPTVDSGLLAGMGNAVYAEIPKHEDPRQYEIGNVYADPIDLSFTANLLHSAGENRLVKTQTSGQPTDVYSEVQKNRPTKPHDDGKPTDVYSEVQKNRPPKPSSDVPTAGHRNKASRVESEGGANPKLVISIEPKTAINADQPVADEGNDYELTLVENQIYL